MASIGALLDHLVRERAVNELDDDGIWGLEVRAIEMLSLWAAPSHRLPPFVPNPLPPRDQAMQINADALLSVSQERTTAISHELPAHFRFLTMKAMPLYIPIGRKKAFHSTVYLFAVSPLQICFMDMMSRNPERHPNQPRAVCHAHLAASAITLDRYH